MFEIKETDKGIELDLSNSEQHTRTGVKLSSFTYAFTLDEWFEFTKEVAGLAFKLYPEAEPEVESEPEKAPENLEDMREDLQGQADQIHDLIERAGPLTYKEIAKELGISPKRASNLVSQMVRDGVELKREGRPRKVDL